MTCTLNTGTSSALIYPSSIFPGAYNYNQQFAALPRHADLASRSHSDPPFGYWHCSIPTPSFRSSCCRFASGSRGQNIIQRGMYLVLVSMQVLANPILRPTSARKHLMSKATVVTYIFRERFLPTSVVTTSAHTSSTSKLEIMRPLLLSQSI